MLQHLLPQTHPPVSQPQIGHGAPLTHLIAPSNVSPQLLVSIDELWELKLWHLRPDTDPVEYLSVTLTEEVLQAQWCQHTPGRLWCLNPQGHLGYYDFDLVKHQATFQAFASLPPLSQEEPESSHQAQILGFCQSPNHLFILSSQGLWQTPFPDPTPTSVTASPVTLNHLDGSPQTHWKQAETLQAQITMTANGLFLGLLSARKAQVFHIVMTESASTGTCEPVFNCELETPATGDTAFLIAPQGRFLAVDRHVYSLYRTPEPARKTTRHTYYGRPLAFFDQVSSPAQPCLLWASGDTLFTTALSEAGEILRHQEMQYPERYASWPIFWSFAVADTRSEVPAFWVADHHRHNASTVIAPLLNEALMLTHSLVGEGGWVESLHFTSQNRLYLGGGQKGTLCQLLLPQNGLKPGERTPAITLGQHYIAPPQAVESLWSLALADRELLLTLSAGGLRCYDAQQSQPIEIPPPPAPWHKALENGALEHLSVLPQGWVAQFSQKGKISLQHYDIATQRWQVLSQKLPEQALLLAAISEQELLMEHDNPTGLFKLYFPHSQRWQDLPCVLEGFDQVLWSDPQQLLAILWEGDIEVWHRQALGQWHCCHQIHQASFFNGMGFSESSPTLFTLDNNGDFKHWQIHTEPGPGDSAQQIPSTPQLIHHTPLGHWGPEAEDRVVSLSKAGRWIALGDRDQPLRIWDGFTGELYATVLACVNAEGTDTEVAHL